ncbi:MAG TPA: S9 family peptidase [Alphaproteobacteria bacterium]|nr:S9 family peptidase [Alphaproteobacteria bacterium]
MPSPIRQSAYPAPPVAKTVPSVAELHGERREDPYAWLRDPAYPTVRDAEILAYLRDENAYTDAVLEPEADLKERLFQELKGRMKEDDSSVPARNGPYWYRWRTETGKQYGIYCRLSEPDGPETVLLDVNAMAEGHSYFQVATANPSPDHSLLAFAEDADGSERWTIRFKDTATGALLADTIPDTSAALAWANDNRTVFYCRLDASQRPRTVLRHVLGTPVTDDVVVYEEADETCRVGVYEMLSGRLIGLGTGNLDQDETYLLDADAPESPPRLVAPRRPGHRYAVSDGGDRLFIQTNDRHPLGRLVAAPLDAPGEAHWQELVPGRDGVELQAFYTFRDFLMLREVVDGLPRLRVIDRRDGAEHMVALPETVCTVHAAGNYVWETDRVRLSYQSLVSPPTVFDYAVAERRLETLKVQEIPSGYDRSLYASERRWVTARDGTRVPLSLVWRRDRPQDGRGPLFLYGYGSYRHAIDPYFSANRLTLLDRGFAYAIAHIRGGAELGDPWHDAGRLLNKPNTAHDFIDCAEYLVAEGFTARGEIVAMGGSAGGTLMGTVANQAPDLFKALLALVPFVDVINTLMDESLPLTTSDYEEWGDPKRPEIYRTMLRYSPYDNVRPQAYPHLYVTAGLTDPRVTYWEPAKWVAKLRATKTDDNLLLLRTIMEAGHGGASGRYDALKELAEEYAFILKVFERS